MPQDKLLELILTSDLGVCLSDQDGTSYIVLEYALKADFSLVKCNISDRYGNLTYHATARNFGPIMCTAAKETIVQSKKIVELGDINPENVITPGIYVDKVIEIENPAHESELVESQIRYLC